MNNQPLESTTIDWLLPCLCSNVIYQCSNATCQHSNATYQCMEKLRLNILYIIGASNHKHTLVNPIPTCIIQFIKFTYYQAQFQTPPLKLNIKHMTPCKPQSCPQRQRGSQLRFSSKNIRLLIGTLAKQPLK